MRGAGFLLLVSCFLIPPSPASAAQACWCRDQAWICTNHSAGEVLSVSDVTAVMTSVQCEDFCSGRQANATLAEYSRTQCQTSCVEGGSCTVVADRLLTGLTPALNTCIVRDLSFIPNVASLTACCEANQVGDVTPPKVGYSGTVQNCPAGLGPIPSLVPSTTVIRLFNPLGSDVDIPGFIGRGIRGVLGVIGAIALLMFVYGGVTWMTAGDSERVGNAKNIIKNSVIGLLLIFFSYNLIGIFFDFFSAS